MDDQEKLFRLYRLLLLRFAPIITEKERRTIGQVKALLDPTDLSIQSLVGQFRDPTYSFERDYMASAQKALSFISSQIDYAKLDIPISFWLSPKEILEHKVADDEDLAVLLCTVLLALGDSNAEVMIAEMTDMTTHAFVFTQFNNQYYLLDPTQAGSRPWTGTREGIFASYEFNGARLKRFLYKFNNQNYEQFL